MGAQCICGYFGLKIQLRLCCFWCAIPIMERSKVRRFGGWAHDGYRQLNFILYQRIICCISFDFILFQYCIQLCCIPRSPQRITWLSRHIKTVTSEPCVTHFQSETWETLSAVVHWTHGNQAIRGIQLLVGQVFELLFCCSWFGCVCHSHWGRASMNVITHTHTKRHRQFADKNMLIAWSESPRFPYANQQHHRCEHVLMRRNTVCVLVK